MELGYAEGGNKASKAIAKHKMASSNGLKILYNWEGKPFSSSAAWIKCRSAWVWKWTI